MRRSRGQGGQTVTRIRAAGVTAAAALALAAGAPASALGADQTPTPSAEELREAYPLDPSEEAGGRSTAPSERGEATPTPARSRESSPVAATAQRREAARPAAEDDGGLSPWLVSGLLAALVAVAATALVIGRRRSGAASPEAAPPKPEAASPLLGVFGRPDSSTPPASGPMASADRQPAVRARREPGARRANGVAAAPVAGTPAGARARRRAAVGQAAGQDARSLTVASSRFTPTAGPEPSPEPRADGGGFSEPPPDPERGDGAPPATSRPDAPAAQDRGRSPQRDPRAPEPASGGEPPDPEARWTAAVEWRASAGEPRFAVLATADEGRETIEIATSGPVRWPPAGPDDVAALNAVVAGLERTLLGAGWEPLPSGDAWYAKRFAWVPVKASAPERPAPPAARLSAVDAPEPFRRRGTPAPARRSGPARQSLAAQPESRARAPRPDGPGRPPAAGGPVDEPATGRFVRRRPWPEDSEGLWRAEIKWDAGYKTSRFTVTMRRPGARRGQIVAASEPFKWMLMAEPSDDGPGYRAAVDALVRALRTAGWERVDAGQDWWAERFIWRHDEPPPDHVDPEPVADRADTPPWAQ